MDEIQLILKYHEGFIPQLGNFHLVGSFAKINVVAIGNDSSTKFI
jgi:hypothetical protein